MPHTTQASHRTHPRRKDRGVDVILTAFRLRTSVEAVERDPSPSAYANALIAHHEHLKAIGGAR